MPARRRSLIRAAAAACCALIAAACTSSPHPDASATQAGSLPATHGTHDATAGPAAARRVREKGEFTIAFAGDVHFAERIGTRLAANPATVFAQAAPGLGKADLTMVNLETAITTGGERQAKLFTFRAPPRSFVALRAAGIDVATMANNHGADYGASGLRDSLAAIDRYHFPVVGIGSNAARAFAPYRTTLNGVRVAIIGADQVQDETTLRLFGAGPSSAGVADAYSPRLLSAVRAAKTAGYLVIVYVHWGIEYDTCPSGDQQTLAAALARAGASAVIGTHAHVLQGAGWLPGGTYVAYGLGNYLWWRTFGNNQDDNGVLTLTFRHRKVVHQSLAPAHLDDRGVPVPATGAEYTRIHDEWTGDRRCTDLAARAPH